MADTNTDNELREAMDARLRELAAACGEIGREFLRLEEELPNVEDRRDGSQSGAEGGGRKEEKSGRQT